MPSADGAALLQPRRGVVGWALLAFLIFGVAPGITPVRHLLSCRSSCTTPTRMVMPPTS